MGFSAEMRLWSSSQWGKNLNLYFSSLSPGYWGLRAKPRRGDGCEGSCWQVMAEGHLGPRQGTGTAWQPPMERGS